MKIYNSYTKRKEEFQPLEGKKVKMYACGITVSGEAHIGHGYQALIYDIMRKYLEKLGYDVTYARNYTDVDDKIIAKSHETGIPADEYAKMMIENIDKIMRKFKVDHKQLELTWIPYLLYRREQLHQLKLHLHLFQLVMIHQLNWIHQFLSLHLIII